MVLITDIARLIKNGKDDSVINNKISRLINSNNAGDINNWRLANYKDLRRWAYPDVADYVDAQVKLLSGDSLLIAKGQAELDLYVQQALSVKTRFPKQ